jgi:hypothetical protein
MAFDAQSFFADEGVAARLQFLDEARTPTES